MTADCTMCQKEFEFNDLVYFTRGDGVELILCDECYTKYYHSNFECKQAKGERA